METRVSKPNRYFISIHVHFTNVIRRQAVLLFIHVDNVHTKILIPHKHLEIVENSFYSEKTR